MKILSIIIGLLFIVIKINAQTDPGKWQVAATYKSFWSISKIQEDYKNKKLGTIITCDPVKKTIIFIQSDTVTLPYGGNIETNKDDDRYDKDCYVYHTKDLGDVIYYPKQKKVVRNYPYNFLIKFLTNKEK